MFLDRTSENDKMYQSIGVCGKMPRNYANEIQIKRFYQYKRTPTPIPT